MTLRALSHFSSEPQDILKAVAAQETGDAVPSAQPQPHNEILVLPH